MSIGYANICSIVQDHKQKFSVYLKYRFWKNKWEQWKQQSKESLKHLKKVLLKSSAPEVMTSSEASSSEAPHQKQDHQKLKIIRRWKNQSFKGCSKVLITPSIAKDQKSKAMTITTRFFVILFFNYFLYVYLCLYVIICSSVYFSWV